MLLNSHFYNCCCCCCCVGEVIRKRKKGGAPPSSSRVFLISWLSQPWFPRKLLLHSLAIFLNWLFLHTNAFLSSSLLLCRIIDKEINKDIELAPVNLYTLTEEDWGQISQYQWSQTRGPRVAFTPPDGFVQPALT